jgi:hypothetical protein
MWNDSARDEALVSHLGHYPLVSCGLDSMATSSLGFVVWTCFALSVCAVDVDALATEFKEIATTAAPESISSSFQMTPRMEATEVMEV